MTLADAYPWFKALHVACALLFVGGVVASGLLLAAGRTATDLDRITPVAMVLRQWDRTVTVPAMLGVWAFGIGLAVSGGWLAFGWLQAKLFLVVILSAIHGLQSGRIRRLVAGQEYRSSPASALVAPAVAAIAILAVIKP
ncbi:CopD family protein [Methylobacterium sp. NMS14P]|uniref:CopD family protein n=1 Tax=Methylobacterium sp. NMS14P TaxID=2894310 RepID=UPI00235A1D2A|nr:CopD family protein [Methylobacterium sp. NMS14P]WCS23699.1 CopD family protein [Methylobacterium sp. NMS14P]